MQFDVTGGVYPTMITPYKNGQVDYEAIESLVEWYWGQRCDGIFTVCQSSEIMFLSLDERIKITRTVKRKADELSAIDKSRKPLMIVASGHISDSFEEQVEELTSIAAAGIDALILISNRIDIENTGDEAWIVSATRLISEIPDDVPLGVYECPKPYKRLLSEKMIKWCAGTGRFYFLKDTCCDAELIAERIKWCAGSPLKIFNANAQTLLATMRSGAYGYCGVMANFHPLIYKWMSEVYIEKPEEADILQSFICLAGFTESMAYPCTAKYHLDVHEGVSMGYESRACDVNNLTFYQKSCVDQMNLLANEILKKR